MYFPGLRSAQSNLWHPISFLFLTVATWHQYESLPAVQLLQLVISFVVTLMSQITTSNVSLSTCLCLPLGIQHMKEQMLSSLPGICAEGRRRGPHGADLNSLGVQATSELQDCLTGPACIDRHAGQVPSEPTGVSVTALWANGEPREAGVREVLTHKVRQQDDQRG